MTVVVLQSPFSLICAYVQAALTRSSTVWLPDWRTGSEFSTLMLTETRNPLLTLTPPLDVSTSHHRVRVCVWVLLTAKIFGPHEGWQWCWWWPVLASAMFKVSALSLHTHKHSNLCFEWRKMEKASDLDMFCNVKNKTATISIRSFHPVLLSLL